MNRPIILGKHNDVLIPKQEFERVLALGPTCMGLAACMVGKDGPVIQLDHQSDLKELVSTLEKGETLADVLNDTQNKLIKNKMLFWFSNNSGVVRASTDDDSLETPDMQPFVVLEDANGRIDLVASLIGNFSEYHKADSHHTDEHHALHNDLVPALMDLYGDKQGNIRSVMDEIRKRQSLQKLIRNMMLDDDGVILLMASDGDILPITKKDGIIHSTDWGITSKVFDNVLEKTEAKETVKQKLGGLLTSTVGKLNKPKPVADAVKVEPKVPDGDKTDTKLPEKLPDGPTQVPGVTVENGVMYAQYPGNGSKNQKKEWYMKYAGFQPQNFKNNPRVEVKTDIDTKDLKSLGKIVDAKANEPKQKDTEPHNVKASDTLPVASTALGVIAAAEKEKLKSDPIIIKALGKNGEVVPSMEQLAEDEKKYGSLEEQTTIRLDDLSRLSDASLLHFLKTYPTTALVAFKGLRGYRMRLEHEKRSKETKQETETVAAPAKKTGTGGGLLRARM